MPQGWVVEAITRQAGHTLVVHQKFNVAIEDQAEALAAVGRLTQPCWSVRIEARDRLSESTLRRLGLAPGDVKLQ